MIYQVRTEDLKEGWKALRPYILEALPPQIAVHETAISNILKALLIGDAQLWLVYPLDDEETRIPIAIAVTTVYSDPLTRARSLLIYSFTAIGELTRQDYLHGIQDLKKYAKEKNCYNLIAFIENENLVGLIEKKVDAQRISTVVRL